MPDFLIKPIFWNTNNYTKPSGAPATSGYPKDHGFGHEEWNNSPKMDFSDENGDYHAFHTEGLKNLDPEDGATFVFLIASHDGVQQLVGVAGNATALMNNEPRRIHLAKTLSIIDFEKEAWEVESVKACHDNDERAFKKIWNEDVKWIPNWFCPADLFLWLKEPVTLDASSIITGKTRLVTMYSAYSPVDAGQARAILEHIPNDQRTATWGRLSGLIRAADRLAEAKDIDELENRKDISITTKETLANARRGQGRFRRDLENRWDNQCAVTGCNLKEVNRASHIKAWHLSSDAERLDGHNGILLAAHIDALFDRGIISFSAAGKMLVSKDILVAELDRIGLPMNLRKPLREEEKTYLSHHRRTYGFPAS